MPAPVLPVPVSVALYVCPMDASAVSNSPSRLPHLPIYSPGFRLTQTPSTSLLLGSWQPKLPFYGACNACWVRAICLSTVSSAQTTVPLNPPAGRLCPWLVACAFYFALSSFCNGVSTSQYTWIVFLAFSMLSLTASVVAHLRLPWASLRTKCWTSPGHPSRLLHRFITSLKRRLCLLSCELFPLPELKLFCGWFPCGSSSAQCTWTTNQPSACLASSR